MFATAPLGELCDILSGFAWSSSKFNKDGLGLPIIRIQNVDANGRSDFAYWNEPYNERFIIRGGDLLLTLSGSFKVESWAGADALLNQRILKLTPSNKIHRGWLLRVLHTRLLEIEQLGRHALINNVSVADIRNLEIPLPPLPEQIRIAAILDKADALRVKRREALAQLDSLTQAIFIDMFGDPRENEKRWEKQPIAAFISDMRGGAPLEPDDFIESGFPILHKGAIKPQGQIHLDTKKKTFVAIEYATAKPRCVANREFVAVTLRDLVPSGPSIGLAADLRDGPFDEYVLAQGAYAFRIDTSKVATAYFVHLSNMPTFRYVLLQNAVGSTQIHIRTPIYLAIKVPLPPITLQRQFSQRVSAIEKLRMHYRTSLLELDSLFASLQYRAFLGKL